MFLGEDLLPLLVLALGAAMALGNIAALVRPPQQRTKDSDLTEAPKFRSWLMISVGAFAAIWALATLLVA